MAPSSNSFTIFTPLTLLTFSLPLAALASFTTALAFLILALRVTLVYIEVAGALLTSWVSPPAPPKAMTEIKPPPRKLSVYAAASARRRRKSSLFPYATAATQPHLEGRPQPALGPRAGISMSIDTGTAAAVGHTANRDYEGVGGWRISEDSEDENGNAWMGLKHRLVLPLPTPGYGDRLTSPLNVNDASRLAYMSAGEITMGEMDAGLKDDGEHAQNRVGRPQGMHKRSLTSLSQRYARSPEQFRMSPVESRRGTPPAVHFSDPQHHNPSDTPHQHLPPTSYFDIRSDTAVRMMSEEEAASERRLKERRLSFSGSSGHSSKSSSSLKLTSSSSVKDLGIGPGAGPGSDGSGVGAGPAAET